MPQEPVEFNLCLPENQRFETKLRRYAVAGQILQGLDDQDRPTSATAGAAKVDEKQTLILESRGIMRDCAIYRLGLTPNFWNPWDQKKNHGGGGELAATVEIRWPASADNAKPAAAEPKGMDAVLHHLVANPGDVGRWPVARPTLAAGVSDEPADPRPATLRGGAWWRLRVERDGLYRLTARDLARLGVREANALAKVRIFSQGRPMPLWRLKAAGEECVAFYGWGSGSKYDARQVYWMTLSDKTPDAAGPEVDAATLKGPVRQLETLNKTAACDRDNELKVHLGNEFMRIAGGDWVDCELEAGTTVSVPLELTAPALAEGAALKAHVKFVPSGDPETWNGTEAELRYGSETLAKFTFHPDEKSFDQAATLPAKIFAAAGRTTLTLEVTKATTATLPTMDNKEGIWLDSVEAAYPGRPALERGKLVLDAAAVGSATTGTLYRVEALAGAEKGALCALEVDPTRQEARRLPAGGLAFHVDSRRRTEIYDPAQAPAPAIEAVDGKDDPLRDDGATLLIITHATLKETVKPLAELHGRLGYKSRIVDVQRLYDCFSGGQLSPLAIRAYLAYAARHWRGGLPGAVLLFGDCSEDYRGDFKGSGNLVPSYTYALDNDQWPSDYWYSTLLGDDHLPDLMISRISVNNLEDARAVVAKTVRYAGLKAPGPWRGSLTLVADNLQDYRGMAETARQESTPPEIETPRIYLDELPLEDNWYIAQRRIDQVSEDESESLRKVSGVATTKIKDQLNSGTAVLEYLGHGSPNIWAHERIWFGGGSANRDSVHLKADGRYAFILNYSCSTGKIDYPIEPWNVCISEDLLRTADGGAIGLFVPAGLGSPGVQQTLMRRWHEALFGDRLRGMGELATLVRARFAAEKVSENHLFMYHLLGDPTVPLQFVEDWRPLKVTPQAIQPGSGPATVALNGIAPAGGKARLWLESERGEKLWEGETFAYREGSIQTTVKLPEGLASPQRLSIGLYAWNEEEGGDLLASGELRVERPAVEIRSARAVRGGDAGVSFTVVLANTGRAATGEFNLKVLPCPADPGAEPLATQTLSLAGGEARQLKLTAKRTPKATGGGAPCFEAVVETAQQPDAPAQAWPLGVRFALTPSAGWTGWAPALGEWKTTLAGNQVRLCALTGAKPAAPLRAVLRAAGGNVLTTLPLALSRADDLTMASGDLPPIPNHAPQPGDVAELIGGEKGTPLGRMTLGELPRTAAVLRLDQGSIRHTPEKPTEGETIFVSFNVQNVGNAASAPCTPDLLNKPLAEGGKPLPRRTGLAKPIIPALAPGHAWPVTLRWDPERNAGIQSFVVDVNPATGRSAALLSDQSASGQLYVATKSRLARGRKLPPLRGGDPANPTFELRTEVLNQGETDARNVEVLFYRTPERKELLGTVPLPRVPAGGAAVARLKECRLNPASDHPVSVIRLKGSSQVITD
jgi:hypothetical protein